MRFVIDKCKSVRYNKLQIGNKMVTVFLCLNRRAFGAHFPYRKLKEKGENL